MDEIWLFDRSLGGRRDGTNKLTHEHERRLALGLGKEGGKNTSSAKFITTATTKRLRSPGGSGKNAAAREKARSPTSHGDTASSDALPVPQKGQASAHVPAST